MIKWEQCKITVETPGSPRFDELAVRKVFDDEIPGLQVELVVNPGCEFLTVINTDDKCLGGNKEVDPSTGETAPIQGNILLDAAARILVGLNQHAVDP